MLDFLANYWPYLVALVVIVLAIFALKTLMAMVSTRNTDITPELLRVRII